MCFAIWQKVLTFIGPGNSHCLKAYNHSLETWKNLDSLRGMTFTAWTEDHF